MTQKQLTKMLSIVSHNVRYYYEEDGKGNKVLKHILVGSPKNILAVPADGGITIDTVPPDSVGSEEIEDGSIQMQDLSDDVRSKMTSVFAGDDQVRKALGL